VKPFEDTDSLPYDPGTGGSKSTNTSGHAAYQVAREVRERLVALAAQRLGCSPEKIQQECDRFVGPGRKAVSFDEVARAVVTENGGAFTHLANYEPKDVPPVTAFTVQVAEVEVDPDTGQVKVKKITSSNDAGIVLNKQTYQAQVDGGVVTGLGFALMEETPMVDGRIATANMGDFKLPSTKDIPKLNTVILESPTGPVPFRGKAIAELPNVPTAAAIANAVADAVGVRVYDLPLKAEKIYWGLNQK
jgi:CO/xanthine dehydrogenase Mo-binding subunit